MKGFTDINQSKQLAEFLPLESADTIWDLTNPDLPTIRAIPYEDSDYSNKYLNIIPCWGLAALLGVLPDEVGDNHYLTLDKEGKEYCCCYEDNNGNISANFFDCSKSVYAFITLFLQFKINREFPYKQT